MSNKPVQVGMRNYNKKVIRENPVEYMDFRNEKTLKEVRALMKIPKEKAASRKCLKCGKFFHSSGIGNRMCLGCSR